METPKVVVGMTLIALGLWVFWYVGQDDSITEETELEPLFAGKEVTIIQNDGAKIRGKMQSEPEDCAGYVILRDAQEIEDDDGKTIEDGTIYDLVAIPIECTASIRIEDLDKAPV
jgi:hypothetical protein